MKHKWIGYFNGKGEFPFIIFSAILQLKCGLPAVEVQEVRVISGKKGIKRNDTVLFEMILIPVPVPVNSIPSWISFR